MILVGKLRNRIRPVALLIFLLAIPRNAAAITADEIVAKNVEARGGAAALASLKSLRRTGRLRSARTEPPRHAVRGEGTAGADPAGGARTRASRRSRRGTARRGGRSSPSKAARTRRSCPTTTPSRSGSRRTSTGAVRGREGEGPHPRIPRDRGRGRHARAQAARPAEMGRRRDGLDRPRHVDGRSATCRTSVVRGAEQEVETDYGDYEKAGGVFVPMSEESGPRNSPPASRARSIYDKAEANVAVAPDAFAFPAKSPRRRERADESRRAPRVLVAAFVSPRCAPPAVDSGTISGLGARNIGSADDERPHRRGRGPSRGRREGHALRRRRLGRRLEVARRRDDVQARLRQAARAVHRRDRTRPVRPEGRLGGDGRDLDAQLRVRRGRRSGAQETAARPGRTWGSRIPSA